MAHDIFLSYARTDRAAAKTLSDALSSFGHSTWSDRDLLPTTETTFESTIEQRLSESSSVVVLWSRTSVESAWVKAESDLGRLHRKLVQVRLDETQLPLPFGSYHCASLIDWNGDRDDSEFISILRAIEQNTKPPRKITHNHNYYNPPEDVPTYGYKLSPPYHFDTLRSSLRPREVLMCFLRSPTGQSWNSACHIGSAERLEDFRRDYGETIELYAVEKEKLGGGFDEEL